VDVMFSCARCSTKEEGITLVTGPTLSFAHKQLQDLKEINYLHDGPGLATKQTMRKAIGMVAAGQHVVLPSTEGTKWVELLRRSGIPSTHVLLYSSPEEIAASAPTIQEAHRALRSCHQSFGGAPDTKLMGNTFGRLSKRDVARAFDRLKARFPNVSRTDKLETEFLQAVGLSGNASTVHLYPRANCDAVLSSHQLQQLHSVPLSRVKSRAPTSSSPLMGTNAQSNDQECSTYQIVENGYNAMAMKSSQLPKGNQSTLKDVRNAMPSSTGPLNFFYGEYPVAKVDEPTLTLDKMAPMCTLYLAPKNAPVFSQAANKTKTNQGPILASQLSMDQWQQLLMQANLFRAYLPTPEGPKPASKLAFDFVSKSYPNYYVEDGSKTSQSTEKDATSASSSASSGSSKSSGLLFVGWGNEKASGTSSTTTTSKEVNLSQWFFPRATIYPLSMMKLSKNFISDVTEALSRSTTMEQCQRLWVLMNEYGTYAATNVLVGGKLYQTSETESTSTTSGSSSSKSSHAGLSLPFVSVSVAKGKQGQGDNVSGHGVGSSNYQSTGGDSLLTTNGPAWVSSVADMATWRVLEFREYKQILDLLPKDLLDKVNQLRTTNEYLAAFGLQGMKNSGLASHMYGEGPIQIKADGQTMFLGVPENAVAGTKVVFRPLVSGKPYATNWKLEKVTGAYIVKTLQLPNGQSLCLTSGQNGAVELQPRQFGALTQLWRLIPNGPNWLLVSQATGRTVQLGSTQVNTSDGNDSASGNAWNADTISTPIDQPFPSTIMAVAKAS